MKTPCILILLLTVPWTLSLSENACNGRRNALKSLLLVGGSLQQASSHQQPVMAACIPGDLSAECIGVYKFPEMSEKDLASLAPDVKYVAPAATPKTAAQAVAILQAQRSKAADDISDVIAAGRLEEAGIKLLNLIPKVTAAGRVLIESTGETSRAASESEVVAQLRLSQMESRYEMMIGTLGQCDVSIGQGLRGQMGVSAVAQLNILDELKDAIVAFDDFLAFAPRTAS